jgi:hypothetical protein
MWRAVTSFLLPGSPTIRALTLLAASRSTRLFSSSIAGDSIVGSGHVLLSLCESRSLVIRRKVATSAEMS